MWKAKRQQERKSGFSRKTNGQSHRLYTHLSRGHVEDEDEDDYDDDNANDDVVTAKRAISSRSSRSSRCG